MKKRSRDLQNPFLGFEMDFEEMGLDLVEIGCEMGAVHIEMKCFREIQLKSHCIASHHRSARRGQVIRDD